MKVSQAMIVKNEEKNIERALSWGKGVVSEQIVADTGSTDRTVEIANIALVEKDPKVHGLRTAIADIDTNGQVVSLDSTVRLFRNREDIRYRRAIHEQLCLTNGEDFRPANCGNNLTVLHTGYQAEALSKKLKENRNINLLQKELEKNPEEFDLYVYLGMEYAFRKKWKEAIMQYRKFYAFFPEQKEKFKAVFSMALSAHLHALYQLSEEERTEGQEVLDTERHALFCEAEELLEREGNSSRKVQTISIQSRCCITGTAFMKMCFPSFSSFLRKRRKSKTPHFPKRRFPKCCPSTGCSPILISGLESTGRRCSMPPQCCNRTRSRWMSYRLCSLPFPGRVRPGEK